MPTLKKIPQGDHEISCSRESARKRKMPWLSAVQRHNDAKLRMLHIQYSSRIDTHLINIVILRHIKMTLQLCEAF